MILGIYEVVADERNGICQRLKKTILQLLSYSGVAAPKQSMLSERSTFSNRPDPSERSSFAKAKTHDKIRNKIPSYYENKSHIVGKDRTVYKMHSGIAFQTQNFPCSENFKKFPTSVLNPGENYKHTIIYKFWIRAGNPSKWIKKNKQEMETKS